MNRLNVYRHRVFTFTEKDEKTKIGFNGAETNCRIAHILGILLMNSCNTDIFFSNYYHLQSVRFELHSQFDSRQSGKITWLWLVKSRSSMLELSRKQENSQTQVFKSSFFNPPTHFGDLIRWSPILISSKNRRRISLIAKISRKYQNKMAPAEQDFW